MSAPKLHLVTSAHDLPEDKRQRTAQHKLNLPITPTAYWLVILTSLLCLSDVVPLHVPVVDGLGENRPTQRKQIIYDQLQHHSQHLTTHLLRTPLPHPPSLQLASCVHTPDYLSFLERAWSEWSAHVASRTHDTYMTSQMTRAGGDASVFLPGQIAARDGSSVVTAGRVDGGVLAGLSRPGGSIHSQICYYALDRLTPIQAHTLTDLANDLRVIQTAASLIPPPLSPLTPPAEPVYVYALTTQPGHHAHTSAFGGYCYVATAAVCAALLREKGYGRVGVLDVDYHAGNGTVQIFYGTSEVFVATLHADPDIDYPYAHTLTHSEQLQCPASQTSRQHSNTLRTRHANSAFVCSALSIDTPNHSLALADTTTATQTKPAPAAAPATHSTYHYHNTPHGNNTNNTSPQPSTASSPPTAPPS